MQCNASTVQHSLVTRPSIAISRTLSLQVHAHHSLGKGDQSHTVVSCRLLTTTGTVKHPSRVKAGSSTWLYSLVQVYTVETIETELVTLQEVAAACGTTFVNVTYFPTRSNLFECHFLDRNDAEVFHLHLSPICSSCSSRFLPRAICP